MFLDRPEWVFEADTERLTVDTYLTNNGSRDPTGLPVKPGEAESAVLGPDSYCEILIPCQFL